jgi:hypothetical protein
MNRDYYETTDLGLAAALTAVGFMLADVNKTEPRRAIFVFVQNNAVSKAVDDYWNDRLSVSALSYADAMKRLKTRLYS